MNVSPDEAKEALAAIQKVTERTRHSVASSGAYIFWIITGVIWMVGFVATQFLVGPVLLAIWLGTSVVGSAVSVLLGTRAGKRVRRPSTDVYGRRAGLFWLLLVFYCIAVIAVAKPTDGKQVTMFIILFVMIGQLGMGMLVSYASVWWAIPITALALAGYFLLPGYYYLWMGVLVGGSMTALGLYIRSRW